MKGVILSINPSAVVVDLSHEIAPHQVDEAGYFLKCCFNYFPEGTVHLAVVDPGVGTDRRALLVSTGREFFIGPDNGIFSDVLTLYPHAEVRCIDNRDYQLSTVGSTFDGRDVFAPAAAWLSSGVPKELFGPVIHDPVRRILMGAVWLDDSLVGMVVSVDRFGNLISNLRREDMDNVKSRSGQSAVVIHIGDGTIKGVVASYSEGPHGVPCALFNSDGYLEIFLREGRAAEFLKVGRGEQIRLSVRTIQ